MFESIRSRLIVIAVLVLLAASSLVPRSVTVRTRGPDGQLRDTRERRVPLKRGLDLQGGIHLALELDQSRGPISNPDDAVDRALKVIRSRVDELGVTEPLVQKAGSGRIVVELPGETSPARAKQIVQRSAYLEFQMTDKDGVFRRAIPAIDRALEAAGVSERTVGSLLAARAAGPDGAPAEGGGGADTVGARAAPRSAVEQILGGAARGGAGPSARDTSAEALLIGPLSPLLFQGSMPGEYLVSEEKVAIVQAMIARPEAERLVPRGIVLRWAQETRSQGARSYRGLYALNERPIITGEYLTDAKAQLDPTTNQAVVKFTLSRRGGRIFERETGRHVNDNMAIVLDQRVASQPPVIRTQIGQRGQIELGSASIQDAQDLALVLRAGALPAPLVIVEERTVGPSLGRDSIEKGELAGIVGVVLVVLVMLAYYRVAGALAVAALAVYAVLTLGGLAAINATLTLPGIAGLVLSVGMAVDANVLIFERIREELAGGKSLRLGVDTGFKRAMSAIVDSNVTTVLTALFLFQFGTGPVKGFAVTLITGIIASMISAIFVTRTFMMIYLERRPGLQTISI